MIGSRDDQNGEGRLASLNYRPEIDGLRAIAVAAVVLYHADPRYLPGGFVGVDVFFVISGYLITGLLVGQWRATGRIDLAEFYARRVRRLLPALILVVLSVMALCLALLGRQGDVFEQAGDSALASLLMLANLYFQRHSGGYFDAPAEAMPLLHLWSLSVEEQFYLVYPALLLILLRLAPQGLLRRLVALSLASLLLAEFWVHVEPQRAFYQMPARFWELAVGGVAALSAVPTPARRHDAWLMPAGLVLVVAAAFFTPLWPGFPGVGALPAVLGAAALLLGVHRNAVTGAAGALLRWPPVVGLGLISYSLYLWHWPLLAIDESLGFERSSPGWRLGLCAAAVVLAYLSWRFVEKPFRRWGTRVPRRTLMVGALATALAAIAVFALSSVDRVPPEARRIAEFTRGDKPADPYHCHFDYDERPTALLRVDCRSATAIEPTVAVWGDSHAHAWAPFAWRLAEASGTSAAGATMNNCAPGAATRSESKEPCAALNEQAMRWFESGGIGTLVIALRWPWMENSGDAISVQTQRQLDALDDALARLGHVQRVLVMGPLPVLRRPAPTCISLGWESRCAIPREQFNRSSAASWRALDQLASRHPNVVLVDPADFFCDGDRCPVMRDDYALFWDGNHVSASAARAFAEAYLDDPLRYTRRPDTARPIPPVPR